MIAISPATRIYLAVGATDGRKGFNGLVGIIQHRFKADPLSGHLYVFCNRRCNRLRILYWDGSGLWLSTKRLEKGRYSWPGDGSTDKVTLSSEQLTLLLGGIQLERTRLKKWWRRAV